MLLKTQAEQEYAASDDAEDAGVWATSLCRLEDAGIAFDRDDDWALPGMTTWIKAVRLNPGMTLWVHTGVASKSHGERCWDLFDQIERIKANGVKRPRWRQLLAAYRRNTAVCITRKDDDAPAFRFKDALLM